MPVLLNRALEAYFRMIALSAAVQNGDAHLKNFGVLYPDWVLDALVELAKVGLQAYLLANPGFQRMGEAMLAAWSAGMAHSLARG